MEVYFVFDYEICEFFFKFCFLFGYFCSQLIFLFDDYIFRCIVGNKWFLFIIECILLFYIQFFFFEDNYGVNYQVDVKSSVLKMLVQVLYDYVEKEI